MNLSRKQKDEITELFYPYIINSDDILTEEDFNNLLGQELYKSIEKNYQKLWMPNTNILQNMLNSTFNSVLLQESIKEFEEALRRSEVFVETQVYGKALKKLEQERAILISGEPGMGKTSLAYQLAKYFIQYRGYNNFFWVKSVDDIYTAQRSSKRKVIIFDDFWGSIFQESSLAGRDEKRLAKILERIKDERECVLILTTREYVLKQGLEKHADLKEVVEKHKLECRLDEYSDVEKARIFFGHLKQSKLSWPQTKELFGQHKEIVRHANYNPRVIEMFLQNVEIDEHPEECLERFWGYLESPENFWHAIFNNLSAEAKLLSVILLISPIPSLSDHAKKTYNKCLEQLQGVIEKKNFKECFEELEKTVIKSVALEDGSIIIKFQNPSAKDYIFNYLRRHIDHYFNVLLNGSYYYGQLLYLINHYSDELSDGKYNMLMKRCIENFETMPMILADYSEYLDGNEYEYYEESLRETRLSRFFDLVCRYKKNKLREYHDFFDNFIEQFNEQMKNKWMRIETYDLEIYPRVIKRCFENGINFNGLNIISIYFERVCNEVRFLELDYFEVIFPEEYRDFLMKYRCSIQDHIEIYYENALNFVVEMNDVIHYKYLCNEIPQQLSKYGLPYTERIKEMVEQFSSYLEDEITDENEDYDLEDDEHQELELAYNQIVDIYEKEILGEESYLWEEDVQDFIRNSSINESLKNELIEIQQSEDYWYIREFIEDEKSFLFLERNLLQSGGISKNALLFIAQLIAGITMNSGISQKKIIGFLIEMCPDVMYRENALLTKEEIMSTEAYILYFEYEERYFEQLVESGLFVKQGRWYELVNILLVMIPYGLSVANMEKEEKIDYYNSVDMANEWSKLRIRKNKEGLVEVNTYLGEFGFYYYENSHWEKIFFKMFLELDSADYLEHYVLPMLQSYYELIKRETTLETVANILNDLHFRAEINKHGENVGSVTLVQPVWRLIESLGMACTDDLVPEKFSEEQMKYTEERFELVQDKRGEVYHINFAEIENMEIVSKLKLDKAAVKVYIRARLLINQLLGYQDVRNRRIYPES
ncbi:ATPase family associated with various cellular activities (AAA) [Paenibacillus tianmuensis]|uniref:ATPase family associated with various cellular activities (AAA) n=2 Tax=Paenibacillus tianmuensis TaxID=624147 RepID=A0A1G4U102_9BACL|nr:ATPase family associated with various cellular activities (AAA) [Paenibacillus tianmuensis]